MADPFGMQPPQAQGGFGAPVTIPVPSPVTEVQHPSPLPLIVSVVALVLSLAVWFLFPASFVFAIVGYVLTPFVVVLCLGWSRAMHLNRSKNPWYDRARGRTQMKMLQGLSFVAFVIGFLHIWRIATEVASWFA